MCFSLDEDASGWLLPDGAAPVQPDDVSDPYRGSFPFPFDEMDLPSYLPSPFGPTPCHRRTESQPTFHISQLQTSFSTPPPRRHHSSRSQSSDADFDSICSDADMTFNPQQLGFIPAHSWTDSRRHFGDLVTDFFRKKSSSNSRFLHKLYNALKIYESDPFYAEFLGVEWLTDSVIKVEKAKFARLLGIKSVDGSLFHQQGNFPSHGFVEVSPAEARQLVPPDALVGVDFDDVRLVVHQSGEFRRGCGSDIEERCRWINGRKKGDQD
jgi:hypothetical protein